IEWLKQGESINVHDLETNLYWEFGQFTSRDGESFESYYSRFYKMMNELVRNKCDVTNHQVNVQFLLQLQLEWQSRANQDNSPRINRGAGYDNKRLGNIVGARETVETKTGKGCSLSQRKMLLCKQEEARIQLNAKQADWRDDTDDEFEDQELEAHYMYMAQIQDVSLDAAYSRPIFDTKPVEQIDQNDDDDDLTNERELLAFLIEKLKCEIDDSKNRNKFLETSNKVIVDKLKAELEDFKNKNKSLESSNNHFKEANNKLSETNVLMYNDLKKFQAELDRRNDELSAHQETISILSQAKEAQIKLYKTREDKELDKVIVLENKVKDLDNIVYKTRQSVQIMNMLNRNCKTSFAKPEFLKKAQRANPRLYDICCYNDNLALMLPPKSDEVIRLEKEIRSKLSDLIRPFDYDKLNNLYDLFIPRREKSSEQRYFLKRSRMSHTYVNNGNSKESFNKQTTLLEKQMDESILYDQKCKSSKELFKIKRSVATIFDGVERCKQTIAKRTYFGHIDPFIQNTIEANFCPEIRRISADLENFHLVEIILFIIDSGCSKHMTGNLKLVINFVEKLLGTMKFGNDQIEPILGYGDLVQGAVTIKRVYYVEGLNHNLFSVGQFCDADLKVAFRKSTCYICDLKGNDLLT
nr:integrase, catalytic region, zinc finger, CCHC-type, peptidase aspartic, catalytic [Tanacetum cinerariifolium]